MMWVPVWVHMPVQVHLLSFFRIVWNNVRRGVWAAGGIGMCGSWDVELRICRELDVDLRVA